MHDNPHEEVYLTFNDKPIIKMTPVAEKKSLRQAGIAKGKFTFDDELFDAPDAKVDKMFFGGVAQ